MINIYDLSYVCHVFVICKSYVVFPVVGGEKERMREKRETTDNLLFKNLRGRWRPQYSDWPVLAFPSTCWHLQFFSYVTVRLFYDGL